MVRLILGRAGTGKTGRIFNEIAARVAAGEGGTILLVPEQYSHEAERELCAAAGDRLSAYAEVMSFTALARRVFSDCGGARELLDAGGRLLCMAVAAEEAGGALRLYGRARRNVHLLTALISAVDELKNAGLDAPALMEAAAQADGALADKLTDLAVLLEAFNAVQGRSGADSADALALLAELIGQSSAVCGCFYVDGFTDFTALERGVLRAIIAAGADITVCLSCTGDDGSGPYVLPARTARWLERTAEEQGQTCRREWMERAGDDTPIDFFCAHLFDFSRPEAPENDGSVTLVTAATPYEECELAAARMRALAQAGCRWRDMAVAVRGFDGCRSALEAACERYGVPLFLSGRGDILRKSLPLAITSALECVTHGWEYEAVFGYLKTGLAGIDPAELDELENYVILWSVRGRMWQRPFTQHPDGYNQPVSDASRERLKALELLRGRIAAPLQRLERALSAAQTARAHAMALADFLEDIALAETLEARAAALDGRGDAAAAMEYRQLWELVCTALEQFALTLGDMPMDAERFAALWTLMLSQYDVGVIPVSLDRVQAGEMDRMRRRHIRHLLVLGATDEQLPAPDEGGGIFSPDEKARLNGLGLDLPDAEEALGREFGVIVNCLSLPSDTLWISHPLTAADGSPARPSLIVQRAQALLGLPDERGNVLAARLGAVSPARSLAVLAAAGDPSPEAAAALAFFRSRGEAEEPERLALAARAGRGCLSPEAVRAIYGKKPALTASRAEKFNSCRFGYFLQYGLKAKPRQRAVFDPRDYGSFLHEILKNVAQDAMDAGGFKAVTRAQIEKFTDRRVDEYISRELDDFAEKTPRFIYLFRRLRTTVRAVCADMWEELSRSEFTPLEMELDLTAGDVLEPEENGSGVRFSGRVDRVDGWLHNGVLYLRVTDYKTGVRKFSLSDLCRGMDMQMLLYLFTLTRRAKTHFGAQELRPAGVLYVPARQAQVTADSEPDDEALDALKKDGVRRSGLVLDDPEVIEAMEPGASKRFLPVRLSKTGAPSGDALATAERFGALERYIDQTLGRLAEALRAGSVQADPWFKNARDNACALCDYADACLFDAQNDPMRPVTALKTSEAWERIEHGGI